VSPAITASNSNCDGATMITLPLAQLQSVEVIKDDGGFIQFLRFIDSNGAQATLTNPLSELPAGWTSETIVCKAKGYTCIGLNVVGEVLGTEKSVKSLKMYAIPIGACSCDDPTINSLSIKKYEQGTAVPLNMEHLRSCNLNSPISCQDESLDLGVVSSINDEFGRDDFCDLSGGIF